MPEISVIIPAKNEENYIARTIESFRLQEVPYELVVVSNGSTDATANIARNLDAIVIELEKPNICDARNVGVNNSNGSILVFNDADTTVSQAYLEEVLFAVNLGFDYGCPRFEAENNHPIAKLYVYMANIAELLFNAAGGSMFMTRELFEVSGGFNHDYLHGGCSEISKRLRKLRGRYKQLSCTVTPSLRRFKQDGYLNGLLTASKWFLQGQF